MSISEKLSNAVSEYDYLSQRAWYANNHELVRKLEQLVDFGLGSKVDVFALEFEEHLDSLLKERSDNLKYLENNVPSLHYLMNRGWFMNNSSLQAKLLEVVRQGLGDQVEVDNPEFEWHLDNLLSGGKLALEWMEEEVSDFSYLQEQSWFMNNPSLQAKLLEVVRQGLGDRVDVFAQEFEEHLDTLF